jgi:hypothetical protein
MTPSEFKAWFDGFTEALAGVPTKAQWARIKERVSEIDGKTTVVNWHWPSAWPYPYQQYLAQAWPYRTTSGGTSAPRTNITAMYTLGKNDCMTLTGGDA